MTHSMALTKELRPDGQLSGYVSAACSCRRFELQGTAVEVAIGILRHQGGWVDAAESDPRDDE